MASASTPKYAAKSTIRSLKNFSKGYSDIQVKVRTATSNDPWGPSGAQMNELARASFGQQEFLEIMEILDKRLNDKGKNWRHVFKALTVLDYLLHVGSENVVKYAKDNIYIVKTLKEFQYIDEEGKDQGSNARDITALLADDARLKEERRSRNAMRDRMSGRAPDAGHYGATTPVYDQPGQGDDDRELQRALEESRRMARDMESSRTSEDDDLRKALELSKKEEQDRIKTVEKYNELSLTEDWEADVKPVNQYEQQNNVDFFGNDFGSYNNNNGNNNNNVDMFGSINNDTGYLQQQPTGFNNPYLQFQQQQLQQQQLQQQQLMQQQMMQQQQLQQQQQMFMNSMNNPYQQQLMPQMTGAPNIGSNNPFSAFAQKPAMTGQPFNSFQNGQNNNNMNTNTNLNPSSSNNPLGELAFLQNSMTTGTPATSQAQLTAKTNPNDEKYAHLAMALSNRDDGMDTFGNTGQLRIPSHSSFGLNRTGTTGGAANPFQNLSGNNNNTNSLIDIGDNSGGLNRSNTATNPFQAQAGGFNNSLLSPNGASNNVMFSQPTGYGGNSPYNQFSAAGSGNQHGAYSGNTLF
ncbi:hypothetical protein BG006_008032 [Podila minutissima]|uniref:ENTH domain-containing protein n=1 Tax=Podila minutissima TaxID=64525 RepID=A0A9P5SGQ4_9FUNG|nr:hypothetical protein BG006_008032 [Podila minutissima]